MNFIILSTATLLLLMSYLISRSVAYWWVSSRTSTDPKSSQKAFNRCVWSGLTALLIIIILVAMHWPR
jgi:hypothetical protein